MSERNLPEEPKQLIELKESGALTEEKFAVAKACLLKGDEDKEVIIPEIVDEKLDPKFAKEFSEEGFWDKITSVLKKAGSEIIYKALQLFYATQNPACPLAIKGTIYAALGYFILPIDLIPDFIPVVGFSDDLLAIGAAIGMAHLYIDDNVIQLAQNKMRDFFGDDILSEL
ncbi:MAG: DUF1232 domain-containing protein [Fretibacterium sp.]|nr:DUF1232 domain-containing protein [Fretibacterium sp.]